VTIRPYDDADERKVAALWRETWPDSAPHNDPIAMIRQKRAVEHDLFFLAELDREIVGTVMAGYDGHRGWIYTVVVAAPHRHCGIGTALIRHAEAALAGRGCTKVNLQVRSDNAEVVAFYEKLGYNVEERISMGKRL
jgi:ribosomal protein S18 acetylase RimI-like enzyme